MKLSAAASCARGSASIAPTDGRSRLSIVALMLAVGMLAGCATKSPPQPVPSVNETLPATLRATSGEALQDVLTAAGDAIYRCKRNGAQLSWVGGHTEATLVDKGRNNVGTVMPDSYFAAYDGSYLIGRVGSEEIFTGSALPWQRLTAHGKRGLAASEGRFARVTSVQRVRTKGGIPPDAACSQEGVSLYVPYSATYLFYRAAQAGEPTSPTPLFTPGETAPADERAAPESHT